MLQLNHLNIKKYFLKLTGITEENYDQENIIENSAEYIESRVSRHILSDSQVDRCEYAAAVCATYDYILSRNLKEKIAVTQDGRAIYDYKDEGAVSSAYELKKSVLESISNLIRKDDFKFSAIGGGKWHRT